MKHIKHLFAVCLLLLVATTVMAQSQSDNTDGNTTTAVRADVNGDGVVNEADIAEILAIMKNAGGIAEQPKYYWYAGWTEPTEANIGDCVNETYPSAKGSTTMNPAGKTSTTLAGHEINFKTNTLYNQEARDEGTQRVCYIVIPKTYGVYNPNMRMYLQDEPSVFEEIHIGKIDNHRILKHLGTASYKISDAWIICELTKY